MGRATSKGNEGKSKMKHPSDISTPRFIRKKSCLADVCCLEIKITQTQISVDESEQGRDLGDISQSDKCNWL